MLICDALHCNCAYDSCVDWLSKLAGYSEAFEKCVTTIINDVADCPSLLLWVVFFSGIGAVVFEVYLHLRTCWQRGPSLVITILTSWNLFSLTIQRSVTYNGEYNEVISMNNLNGIAKRFDDKENFEHTQRCDRHNLDFNRQYSIYSLPPNRNW